MKSPLSLLVCALIGIVPPVVGQTALTLEQALALAEKQHPQITASLARWNAAEQRAIQAGLRPNPQLIVATEEVPLSGGSAPDYLLGLSQQVRLGKTAKLTKEVAAATRERAALLHHAAINQLRSQVHAAFAAALYTQVSEQLSAKRLRIQENRLALTETLVSAGEEAPEQEQTARNDLAHERLDYRETQALRDKALAALATATGSTNLPTRNLAGDLEQLTGMDELRVASTRLDELPDIQAADWTEKAFALRSQLARASRIPSLNLTALYRRQQSSRRNALDLQAAVSLPLFDNKKAATRAFEADAEAARAAAQLLRLQARQTFNQLRSDLRQTLQRAQQLREDILPRQEQIVRRRKLLFESGETSRLDYEQSRLQLTEQQHRHLQTLRESHHLWSKLQRFLPTR